MLASRHGVAGSVTKNTYVCLSCRLKTQQKRRYADERKDSAKEQQDQRKANDVESRNGGHVGASKVDRIESDANEIAQAKVRQRKEGLLPFIKPHTSPSRRKAKISKYECRTMFRKQGVRARKKEESASTADVFDRPDPLAPSDRALANQVDQHLDAIDEMDAQRGARKSTPIQSPAPESTGESSTNASSSKPNSRTSEVSHSIFGRLNSQVRYRRFSSQSVAGFEQPWQQLDPTMLPPIGRIQARLYHASVRNTQEAATAADSEAPPDTPPIWIQPSFTPTEKPNGIRAQLRQWQELHGHKDPMPDIPINEDIPAENEPVNNLTRLPDERSLAQAQEEDGRDELASWSNVGKEGYDGTREDNRFLRMGDLVEIEFTRSERESVLAVYVQPVKANSAEGQFFTMQGRWMHLSEKAVQYSIPDWVSRDLVEPLLKHLPDPEESQDLKGLMQRAYIEDMSVPRDVAAPLVKRLVDFYNESQDIYRRHATALDNAHDILSHDTDLRYGSLTSAATTLLQTPSNQLPVTALFTVRKALSNGGFAFNIDRRSHRLTGYMQIRSKEQVRMVENVRNWIRQWQDDLAVSSAMDEETDSRRKISKGARIMYGFLKKSKEIVQKNRQNRPPTNHKNVGISKTRLPITPSSDCVKVETHEKFTEDEQEVVRFIEAWSCSQMFIGLPRIESLPPLIMQALGLYDDLRMANGFLFLQELGAIMPYENRIRFDQHLLLPSSQHSKPLQNLMTSLLSMKDNHNFVDSMAGLRHDWKDLPVFCIDKADAHEIDDGVSIEPAGVGADGRKLHWVHIHVANPTAFFSRDHPLAKMARHMGESIYMPERTYMMLPRWATQKYFSLASGRPCMTFSAKMDEDGNTIDNKIQPGLIRNVVTLTPEEVNNLLGGETEERWPEMTYTVGGTPPPSHVRKRTNNASKSEKTITQLNTLRLLADKRAAMRKKEGGLFFDSQKPDVSVWQSWGRTGLSWDHPFRRGIRTVEGDPIIQVKTRGLLNWFAPGNSIGHSLVQELMLLAGETAAAWCAARQIPIIYRSTMRDGKKRDPEAFWEEKIVPHLQAGNNIPLHLGIEYIQLIGYTTLRTTPKKHAFLGLQSYTKVTSPLRRYGDMIHHWQIEAALRHEADTGRSLLAPEGTKPDRSFLPFSAPVLETIMLGLQPRESIITRSKAQAEHFWTHMLIFRKTVFGEDGHLPFLDQSHYAPDTKHPLSLIGPPKASAGTAANDWKPLRVFLHSAPEAMKGHLSLTCMLIDLNIGVTLFNPAAMGMEEPRRGDVWEVYIDDVDVYKRATYVKPVRLVGREGAGIL